MLDATCNAVRRLTRACRPRFPIKSMSRSLRLRSTRRSEQSDNSQDPVKDDVLPEYLEPGITGADLTLPLFDETSTNPEDYLIDLDSDSMEKHPDVRIYFWKVGEALEHHNEVYADPPSDLQDRIARDDVLVKTGREYLRQSRIKREGYYISSDRVLADNLPGNPWYRLPTIRIANQLAVGQLVAKPDEGAFFGDVGYDWCIGEMLKTNIRVPVFWDTIFKRGIVPGTAGWDASMGAQYYDCQHPIRKAPDATRLEVIGGILTCIAGPRDDQPCDGSRTSQVITSIWPDLFDKATENEEEELTPEELERLQKHMGNVEDFLYGKKEYRKKKMILGFTIR